MVRRPRSSTMSVTRLAAVSAIRPEPFRNACMDREYLVQARELQNVHGGIADADEPEPQVALLRGLVALDQACDPRTVDVADSREIHEQVPAIVENLQDLLA